MNTITDDRIAAIRQARGDSLAILVHHYQRDEVVRHADILGDSLELSRRVPGLTAKDIVFCGVHFMAETAAMLAGPGQRVHLPTPDADCVMADMAPGPLVEAVLDRLEAAGRAVLPLAYVNSSAAVKAACGRRGGAPTCQACRHSRPDGLGHRREARQRHHADLPPLPRPTGPDRADGEGGRAS